MVSLGKSQAEISIETTLASRLEDIAELGIALHLFSSKSPVGKVVVRPACDFLLLSRRVSGLGNRECCQKNEVPNIYSSECAAKASPPYHW